MLYTAATYCYYCSFMPNLVLFYNKIYRKSINRSILFVVLQSHRHHSQFAIILNNIYIINTFLYYILHVIRLKVLKNK